MAYIYNKPYTVNGDTRYYSGPEEGFLATGGTAKETPIIRYPAAETPYKPDPELAQKAAEFGAAGRGEYPENAPMYEAAARAGRPLSIAADGKTADAARVAAPAKDGERSVVTNPLTSYNPFAPVSSRSPGGVPYGAAFEKGGVFYSEPFTAEDEEKTREKARKDVQAQIDAINELAASELASARQRGAERLGQTRALAANTGVLGSPTGFAQQEKAYAVNTAEEKAIRVAAEEKVASIHAGVNTRADTLIQASKTLARENADKYMEFLKTQSTDARTDMKALATAGAELTSEQKQKLIDQTGYDPDTFDQLYQGLKIANSNAYINKDKPEIVGNKAVFFKKNRDGTISTETVDLPESAGKEIDTVSTSKDNGVIVFYKDGTWKQVGAGHPTVAPPSDQLYSGLSPTTATAVRSRVSKYATDPTIQNFATVQDGYNFSQSLKTDTKNPADDQALIYSLAKALDPGSVVREGEYATAQKYAQSWVAAYGKGIEQALLGTGFLSIAARDNIKKTIKQKFDSQKRSYDQVNKSYKEGINSLTGRSDGEKFLTDYITPEETGAGGIKDRAAAAGYDYESMIKAGYDDTAIAEALDAAEAQ